MKTIEHTPGPWAVGSNGASIKIVDADGKAVAMVTPRRDWWNADLIAAAPELLDSLKDLENILSCKPYDRDEQKLLVIARAAIAKAKGESNESPN
jgi:hypothetical protein